MANPQKLAKSWAQLLVLMLGLLPFTTTAAEESPRTLPKDPVLSRLIEESFSAAPELSSAEGQVRAEIEREAQADAWSDPMLQVGIQNMGFSDIEIGRDPMSFVSVMASQTFPWPGKSAKKKKMAELSSSQSKQSVSRARLSLEAQVRRAYLVLVSVRDRLSLLTELDGLWQNSLGVARARYEAGDGAQSDVLRAQLEINRIKQRRIALEAEERTSLQTLNRLRKHPLDEAIEGAAHVSELPSPQSLKEWFDAGSPVEKSPEFVAARLATSRYKVATALADQSYYPDITVGAGIMWRGRLPMMWSLNIGGPLPFFASSKQERTVKENQEMTKVAQADTAYVEQMFRLRHAERGTAFHALLQTIELYQQGLLVQSRATAESTLAQYKVGKVSFASVLESNAGLIADQEGYLTAVVSAHNVLIAEAELSLLETSSISMPPSRGAGMSGSSPALMDTPTSNPTNTSSTPSSGRSNSGM